MTYETDLLKNSLRWTRWDELVNELAEELVDELGGELGEELIDVLVEHVVLSNSWYTY